VYQIAVDTFGGQTGVIQMSVTQEVDRPLLRAAISGQNLVFSWPTNMIGFVLEMSSNLDTATWNRALSDPVITGADYSLKLPLNAKSQFYRLRGL
jgi:hypothetical protein